MGCFHMAGLWQFMITPCTNQFLEIRLPAQHSDLQTQLAEQIQTRLIRDKVPWYYFGKPNSYRHSLENSFLLNEKATICFLPSSPKNFLQNGRPYIATVAR